MNLIGKMLDNRYEILEKIGNGGMATVYKAKCHVLNRYVAIKILRDEFTTDTEFIKRFNTEAQSAASLTHPNIVSIYDVGNEDNLYYIVMELIQGKTLKEIINEDGILSWKWSVNIAIQIASALETAHKHNIIHRDIKPHNIIITEDGMAKVTDFGIAKAVSNSTITAFGTTIGSVHYFSPEHARGGYTDAKSDLYSLGIVMYEMLTGRVPFDADTPVSVALKQVQEEPIEPITLNENIPVSVNRIILKAMQKEPSMRYQNATEMLEDLRLSLKKPDEDFVTLNEKGEGSPTQRIPTIYEIEKNGDRKENTVAKDEKEKKKGKFSKIKEFYSKHKVLKIFTIIFACILLFFIVMFGTIHALNSSRPKEYEIVDLVWKDSDNRLTKDQAEELLKNSGFTNYSFEEEYSDEVEAGYVISQTPVYQPNYTYNVDQEIVVLVSKGQKMITIPKKLTGKNIDEVKKALDELEAKYEVQEINDEEVEAGIVLSISPEEGEEITASTTITIEVSKGSAYKDITVKNVVGKTESEAKSQLENDGFTSIEVEYSEDTNKSDGVVLEQSISSGKTVKENEKITLTVNKLPQEATLTINLNLKSLKNYTEQVVENTTDNNTTNSSTTTAKTTATVKIMVGTDTICSEDVKLSETSFKKTWTATGRKEVKVIVDGVTEYSKTINFNDGDQTIDIP
jgi:serine/threonine-protein kinase